MGGRDISSLRALVPHRCHAPRQFERHRLQLPGVQVNGIGYLQTLGGRFSRRREAKPELSNLISDRAMTKPVTSQPRNWCSPVSDRPTVMTRISLHYRRSRDTPRAKRGT